MSTLALLAAILLIAPIQSRDSVAGRGGVRILQVRVQPDTVKVGVPYEYSLTLRVARGRTVYLMDSLNAPNDEVETMRPARWSARMVDGDSAEVRIVYGLVSFRPGKRAAPSAALGAGALRAAPTPKAGASTADSAGTLPNGSRIAPWREVFNLSIGDYVLLPLPPVEVVVSPTLLEFDLMEGVHPKNPADVVGRSWHLPSILLASVGALLLLASGGVALRLWLRAFLGRRRKAIVPAADVEPSWRRTVAELDRILALGLHLRGEMDEFYALCSDAVRRYVESLHSAWGPYLTSTELLASLAAQARGLPAPVLSGIMWSAEWVKFGRRSPDSAKAESDWALLRRWVQEAGEGRKS